MLALRLPPDIEERLEALARRTGRSKSFYAREAILEHLDELEDAYLAEEALAEHHRSGGRTLSIAELMAIHTATRVHVGLTERERDAFQARARLEGESLSEWLRRAARDRLAQDLPKRITTLDDLDQFFEERSERELGREPDWEEHLDVAARSRSGRLAAT